MEFEAGIPFDKPEKATADNENLPEFCSLSNEYSMLLKDPWSWDNSAGSGIRSLAAIRKQSYILYYLQDSAAEQQVGEKDCLRRPLFEATDDQLWRPQSPLSITEAMFSLDAMVSHDWTTSLQEESIAQGAASCFRIWEQDDDHKDEKNHADGISFVYGSEVSDWIWGFPSNQSQISESVEFESPMPSL